MGGTFAILKPSQLRKAILCTVYRSVNYTALTVLWKGFVKGFTEWEHCTNLYPQSLVIDVALLVQLVAWLWSDQ